MPKMTAEQIRALNNVPDEQKNDLLSLLTEVDTANAEITKLRKSQPTESQKVVDSVEYAALEKAVKDRDAKIGELEKLAASLQIPKETFNGPFDWIFAILEGK